jgi:LuxR family maltose regulon positive regulatory protein
LESATAFTFKGREGHFTAHKTRASNGRGGWYWYAYRRQHGRLVNFYLGTSAKLTSQRLHAAATALALPAAEHAATSEHASLEQRPIQPGTLLLSKLRSPRLSTQHVARPRLLTLLDQGIQQPLTLISAPAGSGKTTLLAEWVASRDYPLAWLSLEEADNDPARFLAYLLAALTSLDKRIHMPEHVGSTFVTEDILADVLNELTCFLEQEAVVVLDDYHLLTSETVHNLLRFLLAYLPTRLHIIVGTRMDPPLPLARLRGRGQLYEVRTGELRFQVDEIEALIKTMDLPLSHEAAKLLEQRAEGWITGIQLLALALRGQHDATTFLRALRGTPRFLLDYVSEEVLAQQTSTIQHFLLRTCVLERMTGSLCDALTDLPDSQMRLAELQRANLFISALDDTESWYRYHPLFAEILRAQLHKLQPDLLPELYLRASNWYEEQKSLEEACDYALLAGDFTRAARLIADLLPSMVEQGYFERLGRWLGQLPPELLAATPQLYIATPWLRSLYQRSPRYLEQEFKRMEQHVQKQQERAPSTWVEAQGALVLFQALTALAGNNIPRAFALVRKALSTLTRRETALSQLLARFLTIFLSIMYGSSGDLASAEQILLDFTLLEPEKPPSLVKLAAPLLLGELYKAQGQLGKLERLFVDLRPAFEIQADLPMMPRMVVGFLLMRQAVLWYEWNILDEAAEIIQQVLEIVPHAIAGIIPRRSRPVLLMMGLWVQARTQWALGQPAAARSFLELIRSQPETIGKMPPGKDRPPVDVLILATRLALLCDGLEEALYWEGRSGMRFDEMPDTLLESRQVFAYFTHARVLIARGRQQHNATCLTEALALLDHWRTLAESLDFQGWFIEIQMLTALALLAQGKMREALATLGPVLAQAETEGYVRLFVDEGRPMADLLAHISSYTIASPAYIQQLQSIIALQQPSALPGAPQALLDPLSERELEVLSLLATGASNQQIADHLIISLNTAKRHVKNILAKLNVDNRTRAVIRARELHLL